MPNWCYNHLTIYAKNNEKTLGFLSELYESAKKGSLNKFITPYSDMGLDAWNYGSCVEHWGTKWDIGLISIDINKSDNNINIELSYQTAWNPNTPVLEKLYEMLCELDPECTVQSYYDEGGMNYHGRFLNGEDNCKKMGALYHINQGVYEKIEVQESSGNLIISSENDSNLFFIEKERKVYNDYDLIEDWEAGVEEIICFSNAGEEISLYKVEEVYYINLHML